MPAIPYYDWIAHHAGRRPTKLAIHDLQTGRKFTYADVDHRTDRLAAALAGLGITEQAFDAVIEDLQAALRRFRIGEREQADLLALLRPLRTEIVGR